MRHQQEIEARAFHRGFVRYSGREIVAFSDRLFVLPLSFWYRLKCWRRGKLELLACNHWWSDPDYLLDQKLRYS